MELDWFPAGPAAATASVPGFEDIAHAAEGMDQFPLEGIVHLSPQAAERDIDDVAEGRQGFM
jgi:hypothetical protein